MTVAALHNQILSSIVTEIIALGLTSTDRGAIGTRVYKQPIPTDRAVTFPCVKVTLQTDPESEEEGDFETAYVTYSAEVLICDRSDGTYAAPVPTYLLWRQQIITHFRDLLTLPSTTPHLPVYDVKIKYRKLLDETKPEYQHVVMAFDIQVYTTVARTKTVPVT